MKRSVLVVGGAGYIGSCMVQTLLDAGHRVTVFDNLSTGHKDFVPRKTAFFRGDLRDISDCRAVFKKHRVDSVMHFAASSLVGESVEQPLKYYENNVLACVNLLKAMADSKVSRFVFSSSAAVYGEPERVPIDEGDPKRPTNPYGRTKLIIEEMLADQSSQGRVRYAALRYFNACGAHTSGTIGETHNPETHLIPNVLKTLTGKNKEFVIFGDDYDTPDGTCIRDYVHIEDLCDAHLTALEKLDAGLQGAFNLGSGQGYSVKEILEVAEKITGRSVRPRIGPRRAGDPARLVADARKARKEFGWTPRRSLETIVSSAWKWETRGTGR